MFDNKGNTHAGCDRVSNEKALPFVPVNIVMSKDLIRRQKEEELRSKYCNSIPKKGLLL